jgi:hypothetical protein
MSAHLVALLSLLTTVHGQVEEAHPPAFLGVAVTALSESLAAQLGVPGGALVVEVIPDSPAAGVLRPHDVIVGLGDDSVVSPAAFSGAIRSRHPGDAIRLTLRRDGALIVVDVTLGGRQEVALPQLPPPAKKAPGFLGVGYGAVSGVLAVHLRLEAGHGVVVGDVFPGSAADKAGLRQYDVLVSIDAYDIQGVEDFVRLLGERHAGEELRVEFFHAGERKELSIVLDARPDRSLLPTRRRPPPGWDSPMDPHRKRSFFRGALRYWRPDGTVEELEIPDLFLDTEGLQKELERHLRQFEDQFSLEDLHGQLHGFLKGFDLDGDFGARGLDLDVEIDPGALGLFGRRSAEERTAVLTQRDGDLEITVREENGETTVTVRGGDVVIENQPVDELGELEPGLRARVEKLLKLLPSAATPALDPPSTPKPELPVLPRADKALKI